MPERVRAHSPDTSRSVAWWQRRRPHPNSKGLTIASNLNRFIGIAAKLAARAASSKSGSSRGGTDWMAVARQAAQALSGGQQPGAQQPRQSQPYVQQPEVMVTRPGGAVDPGAVARYDALLQNADQGTLEAVHRGAFARITPQQRGQIHARMQAELAVQDRPATTSPDDLARAAARQETMWPGAMRGLLGRAGDGLLPAVASAVDRAANG